MANIPKLWGKKADGTKGFVFSHVKSVFYSKKDNKMLNTKLGEMDADIANRILKTDISDIQADDSGKVPSSALVKGMNDTLTALGQTVNATPKYTAINSFETDGLAPNSTNCYYVTFGKLCFVNIVVDTTKTLSGWQILKTGVPQTINNAWVNAAATPIGDTNAHQSSIFGEHNGKIQIFAPVNGVRYHGSFMYITK